jgi:internalin A
VTDAGLKNLAGLKLRSLQIPAEASTDLGLKHYLAALESPTHLFLYKWKVTDAGLKELAGLKNLQDLSLYGTQVTDAGLKELAGLKNLRGLDLRNTKVTAAGVAALQKDLPACKIGQGD